MINFPQAFKVLTQFRYGGAFIRTLKLELCLRYKKKPSDVQMNFFTLFNIDRVIIIFLLLLLEWDIF
jgi:hypothetical protein